MVSSTRVPELDGMRGVAVMLVLLYHYLCRWSDEDGVSLYPFGDTFADTPIISDGHVGVLLFFIISGFVIAQSLRRSRGYFDFAIKRADRLVLPMMLFSTATLLLLDGPLATAFLEVAPADLLPSWTFSAPMFWRWVAPHVDYVDGAYWTLFVEVRFYIWMSIVWFSFGARRASEAFAALATIAILGQQVAIVADLPMVGRLLDILLFPDHIALFGCGVLYADLISGQRSTRTLALLAWMTLLSFIGQSPTLDTAIYCSLFHAAFLCLAFYPRAVGFLRWRLLTSVGLASYSLYLVHQKIGVALINRIPETFPLWVQLTGVGLVSGMMIAIAILSERHIERLGPVSMLLRRRRPSPI